MSGGSWVLFCTWELTHRPDSDPEVREVGVVNDEIAAVKAFRRHVEMYGEDHIPHIWMQPDPPPEPLSSIPDKDGYPRGCYSPDVLTEPNFFRVPESMKESVSVD